MKGMGVISMDSGGNKNGERPGKRKLKTKRIKGSTSRESNQVVNITTAVPTAKGGDESGKKEKGRLSLAWPWVQGGCEVT